MLSTITKVVILLSAIFHICEPCGGSFSSLNGQLTSPNYPSDYDNNLNCTWEITTPGGYLQLNFVDFITESGPYDPLEIYDGHTGNKLMLLSGDLGSYILYTSTNFVQLVFITDRSIVRKGWNMAWSTRCEATFLSPDGQLTSPNYPSDYISYLNCSWEITAPQDSLLLNFVDFKTERCRYDWLDIFDGHTGNKLIRLCDDLGSYILYTSTNFVQLVFITDGSVVRKGWNLTWSTYESTTTPDYNYASGKSASQSSTYQSANYAVDGGFSSASATHFNQPGTEWWMVDLGNRILLEEAVVYVYGSSSDLSDVYFLTNPHDTLMEPNTNQTNEWHICSHSAEALGTHFTRQCTTGIYQNPVTRLFSIATDNGRRIYLREVLVYGYELPELSEDVALAAEEITTSSITITFSQWNQPMSGALPPTQYTVSVSGGESKTVAHNSNYGRLSTAFNGLNTGQTYTFTVSCTIQGIDCAGPTYNFSAATLCAVPSAPGSISQKAVFQRRYGGRKMWRYTVAWLASTDVNCKDVLQYRYGLSGQSLSSPQTQRRVSFYVDGDTQFVITVRAQNSVGLSPATILNGTSGALEAQFTAGQMSVTATSSYCVTVTWEIPTYPGGYITQYQYHCGGEERQDVEDGVRSKDSCNHEPYTEVTCTVWATNSAGDGSIQNSGITLCADPSPPMYSMNSSSDGNSSTTINIRLQESKAFCEDITEYTIRVRQPDGSLVNNQTTTTGGDYIINDLYGFTNYTVTIEAVNNEGLRSESRQSIVTVEHLPLDGPEVELSFTEDCVLLYLHPPQIPNGKITSYQYRCAEVGKLVKESILVSSEKIKSGIVPIVCELPLATEIECDALAVNSVGESPKSTVSGYTNAAVVSSDISQLMSPAVTNSELVVIRIYPVELEDSTLQVRSYLVLLRHGPSTEEKCDVDRESCITIAEIDSELVTADGYWFYIGDGKLYGGYVNSALVAKSNYSVQIAVSVQLRENGDTFYQTLNKASSFSAPSSHCDPPPAVDNAIAGSSFNEVIGEKVLYTCEDGYHKASGDYQLACVLTDKYESVWTGNMVDCKKEQKWIIPVSVGGGALVLLVVGIAIVIAFIKKRKQPAPESSNNPVQSTELNDYLPAPMASNCASCSTAVDVQPSKGYDACVYENVAMDVKDEDVYETIPAIQSTSEPVYDTC